jgi:5-formyltetrahydrofolate cyclo-ligase
MVFDPELETMLRHQAKSTLRKRMRALRNSIPREACAVRSERIVLRLLESPEFERATGVGLFWPMLGRNEIDLRPLDAAARAAGKAVAYPFLLDDGEMSLSLAEPTSLAERGHGFAEPNEEAPPVLFDASFLVVVPALAVDPNGNRIGYGRGFYDRLLSRTVPPAVAMAVAYDFQVVAEIPITAGDQPVAVVITDLRSFRRLG